MNEKRAVSLAIAGRRVSDLLAWDGAVTPAQAYFSNEVSSVKSRRAEHRTPHSRRWIALAPVELPVKPGRVRVGRARSFLLGAFVPCPRRGRVVGCRSSAPRQKLLSCHEFVVHLCFDLSLRVSVSLFFLEYLCFDLYSAVRRNCYTYRCRFSGSRLQLTYSFPRTGGMLTAADRELRHSPTPATLGINQRCRVDSIWKGMLFSFMLRQR